MTVSSACGKASRKTACSDSAEAGMSCTNAESGRTRNLPSPRVGARLPASPMHRPHSIGKIPSLPKGPSRTKFSTGSKGQRNSLRRLQNTTESDRKCLVFLRKKGRKTVQIVKHNWPWQNTTDPSAVAFSVQKAPLGIGGSSTVGA